MLRASQQHTWERQQLRGSSLVAPADARPVLRGWLPSSGCCRSCCLCLVRGCNRRGWLVPSINFAASLRGRPALNRGLLLPAQTQQLALHVSAEELVPLCSRRGMALACLCPPAAQRSASHSVAGRPRQLGCGPDCRCSLCL